MFLKANPPDGSWAATAATSETQDERHWGKAGTEDLATKKISRSLEICWKPQPVGGNSPQKKSQLLSNKSGPKSVAKLQLLSMFSCFSALQN